MRLRKERIALREELHKVEITEEDNLDRKTFRERILKIIVLVGAKQQLRNGDSRIKVLQILGEGERDVKEEESREKSRE